MPRRPRNTDPTSIRDIEGVPFESFRELTDAVRRREFRVGIDPLAASVWAGQNRGRMRSAALAVLSLTLLAAAAGAIGSAIVNGSYWLLAAVLAQAVAFYLSHPGSPFRPYVTVGGAITLIAAFEFAVFGYVKSAVITGYAGLTFAVVRLAALFNNAAFRKALMRDEALFVAAYANGACTLRDNESKTVYSADPSLGGTGS